MELARAVRCEGCRGLPGGKAASISPDHDIQQVALEIILGFGVLSVEADREEQEALAAIETSSPPAPKPEPEPEEPTDIPW